MSSFDPNYSMLPEHMRESIRDYIENGVPPGGFLRAVLENAPFMTVIGKADDINQMYLQSWARFIYNDMRSDIWGSPEKVDAWIERNRKGEA